MLAGYTKYNHDQQCKPEELDVWGSLQGNDQTTFKTPQNKARDATLYGEWMIYPKLMISAFLSSDAPTTVMSFVDMQALS